jgi:hypothetical protein
MNSFVEEGDYTDGEDREEWWACQDGDTDAIAGVHCSNRVTGGTGDRELGEDHFYIAGMIFYDGMWWVGDVVVLFADYGAAGENGDE